MPGGSRERSCVCLGVTGRCEHASAARGGPQSRGCQRMSCPLWFGLGACRFTPPARGTALARTCPVSWCAARHLGGVPCRASSSPAVCWGAARPEGWRLRRCQTQVPGPHRPRRHAAHPMRPVPCPRSLPVHRPHAHEGSPPPRAVCHRLLPRNRARPGAGGAGGRQGAPPPAPHPSACFSTDAARSSAVCPCLPRALSRHAYNSGYALQERCIPPASVLPTSNPRPAALAIEQCRCTVAAMAGLPQARRSSLCHSEHRMAAALCL